MNWWRLLQYSGALGQLVRAFVAYRRHKDPSQCADDLTQAMIQVARQALGNRKAPVRMEQLRQGAVLMVDGFEPLFDEGD